MDCLRIQGTTRLSGAVAAQGAKNSALPIMAASLLASEPVLLRNAPDVTDVDTLALLLGYLGLEVKRRRDGALSLAIVDSRPCVAPAALVERMRASFCVLGPLVARRGRAIVALPGGCAIGDRPVDLHLAGLAALGADVRVERGCAVVCAPRGLRGATLEMAGPRGSTVTGVANVLMAATVARGVTVIRRAAREPEIVDLAAFLTQLGAQIEGAGTDTIVVRGVSELGGGEFTIIPDRIEASTLLTAAAISGSKLTVTGVRPDHLSAVLAALETTGQRIERGPDWIRLQGAPRPRPGHFVTAPYPGLPSDFQPQLMALLSIADGESSITERVFPSRWRHATELRRFGANVDISGARARLRGVEQLRGAEALSSDLRGGAAIVLAALAARGESVVRGLAHLNRGYQGLPEKLAAVGADARYERSLSDATRNIPCLA